MAIAVLALLNVLTLAAGLTVARMLPPRLARLHVAVLAARPVVYPTPVLTPVGASAAPGQPAPLPTARSLAAMLGAALPSAVTGAGVGIEVADAATGRVLYSEDADVPATPASTTKLVTAVAALAALGPAARFTTAVRQAGGTIVLAGGGDPTLAVNDYPAASYPRPATLAQLAADTARALRAQGRRSVRLDYDTALFSGPGLAPGWSTGDIELGDVTPVVALEADQGRLTPGGALEDKDDPGNYRPRAYDPAGMTAAAFAQLLIRDGITVTGAPAQVTGRHSASAPVLASVSSPPLAAIIEQMLVESNNVIAENLARHAAIALGLPATFSGAAAADMTEVRRLGITTPLSLVDGSGLSPEDQIAPETLVRVLAAAAGRPDLRAAVTGLPVAGFTGTLSAGGSVFGGIGGVAGGAARGVVRAKTGNLDTVATLAGLVYDKAGALLLFAIMAPRVPSAGQLPQAATAVDTAAAGLANCGCR
jgi:D-alanyl-D-alanine carboxypeptidase/D-alanyl-D-alanine-endopeptidase (penicillin-binding protein 4)